MDPLFTSFYSRRRPRRALLFSTVVLCAVMASWIWPGAVHAQTPFAPAPLFVQQGPKLVDSKGGVALSADGNTAIVGNRIWIRIGAAWYRQGPELIGSDGVGLPFVSNSSVAISADGNTALFGDKSDDGWTGAVWVWTRSGNVWTQQGPKLVGSGWTTRWAGQGSSVALSADGNTALVGGPVDNDSQGAAWVWTRSGGVWTQQGPKLVGSEAQSYQDQGFAVALSGDGNTALIGAGWGKDSGAWVWTRSAGVWTQQGPRLVGSGAVGYQGSSVALSGDGDIALVGGGADNFERGAVWVWTRSGGAWTQQGPKLVGSGSVGNAAQGMAVALSADGNTALVGGPFDDPVPLGYEYRGASWVFTRSDGVWTQRGPKLAARDAEAKAGQGWSVSISADGATALVRGPYDNDNYNDTGSVWAYTRRRSVTPWNDFDSDRKADPSVYRPSSGQWFVRNSSLNYVPYAGRWYFSWGTIGDIPLQADFDGDGQIDPAVFRPDSGQWFIRYSTLGYSDTLFGYVVWGSTGDVPITADFDGDGKADITVYEPATGQWRMLYSSRGYRATEYGSFAWGATGDVPRIGDFDSDGVADAAVYRPSTGQWFILYSSRNYSPTEAGYYAWGMTGDMSLTGDFDGDGTTDLGVFRPATGQWFLLYSSRGLDPAQFGYFAWGTTGDVPLLDDFDGDGRTDVTVYRPSTGQWFIRFSRSGYSASDFGYFAWGTTGDTPLPTY